MAKMPIEIAILGNKYEKDILECFEALNSIQNEFEFQRTDTELEGKLRMLAYKSIDYDFFIPEVESIVRSSKGYHPFLVTLIDSELSGGDWSNLFSGSFADKGLGIFTTKSVEGPIIEIGKIKSYIYYYMARFAMDFCIPHHGSHKEKKSCVYDFKEKKTDILLSMKSDAICDDCRREFLSEKSLITYKQLSALDSIFELSGIELSNKENDSIPETEKPKVFIGSSVEGLKVARKIQNELQYDFNTVIWNQDDVFSLGEATMEALERATKSYDFGIFVFTPDDKLQVRGEEKSVARDNVIFELGLFIGKLGRRRAFIVHPRNSNISLPSDLNGTTTATYDCKNENLGASLGPLCQEIRDAASKQIEQN